MKSARLFQLTALILVVVSFFQVCYWVIAQRAYTLTKVGQIQTLYVQQLEASRALLAAGTAPERIHAIFPDVTVQNGQAALVPGLSESLGAEQQRRSTQYLWEGGFFLLALCLCIAVIWRALRAEAEILKEQDNFLALVSHQFKTPLASLQLSLETMALRELPPERSKALIDRMLSDLMRMETMVSQILDSVRLDRGRVEFKREPVPLAGIVTRVVGQFQERAQNDHIGIETAVPDGVQILADPLAVDVVVRNLLENALAAVVPLGGGKISLNARTVGAEVELTVRDSGIGFNPEDHKRLFEKFSRLQPVANSSYYGTGLGLFIVRRLMELVGGRVTARSEGLGRGSEFVLTWQQP